MWFVTSRLLSRCLFRAQAPEAGAFHVTEKLQLVEADKGGEIWRKLAAFSLHQFLERTYSCVLLTLTNYAPPAHNPKFLRSLAEKHDRRLADTFPRDQHRERACSNTLNEAYVKAVSIRRRPHRL